MMKFFITGGPVMFFILGCSIIAIALFLDRSINLHKIRIDTREFMAGLKNELKAKRITEAVSICAGTPGPVAAVLKAGIISHDRGAHAIKSAMEKVSIQEIPKMEKGINLLATVGVITPLLGFLGTILSLMKIFGNMTKTGGMLTANTLASGMWEAMLTTAFGLSVAIPSYLAYNYLVTKVERLITDMEEGATELVGFLTEETVGNTNF